MTTVLLVVPPGVHDFIYPWGVENIKDYLKHCQAADEVSVWDLNKDADLTRVLRQYQPLIDDLSFLLKRIGKDCLIVDMLNKFMPVGTSKLNLCILGGLGEHLWELKSDFVTDRITKEKMTRYSEDVIRFKEEFEGWLKLKMQCLYGTGKVLVGVSVYDATLLSSLYVSSLIREAHSDTSVIFGGDYFTNDLAREVVRKVDWIEGVVVGYGEEVMREILTCYQEGLDLKETPISCFINRRALRETSSEIHGFHPRIPPFYRGGDEHPLSYVKDEPAIDKLHVITQVGCGWGRCTFCGILDKDLCFPLDVGEIARNVKRVLQQKAALNTDKKMMTYRIVFDSETNVPKNVIPVLEELRTIEDPCYGYIVFFWMRVAACTKEFVKYIHSLKPHPIRIFAELGIESLSPETLKNMNKGSDPLSIMERVKTIHDAGGVVGGNYFMSYPLENVRSVRDEVKIIKNILHLLCTPKTVLQLLYYFATDRNLIYADQERFQVSVRRASCFWLKHFFDLDLPLSLFENEYKLKKGRSLAHRVTQLYFNCLYRLDRGGKRSEYGRLLWVERLVMMGRNFFKWANILASAFLCLLLQLVLRDLSYLRRLRLFFYLNKGREAFLRYFERSNVAEWNDLEGDCYHGFEVPKFFISGQTLTKKYPQPYFSNWSIELTPVELELLRFLYWQHTVPITLGEMQRKYPDSDIEAVIEKHIQLGSLVRYENKLLCVAHDPEYFLTLAHPSATSSGDL